MARPASLTRYWNCSLRPATSGFAGLRWRRWNTSVDYFRSSSPIGLTFAMLRTAMGAVKKPVNPARDLASHGRGATARRERPSGESKYFQFATIKPYWRRPRPPLEVRCATEWGEITRSATVRSETWKHCCWPARLLPTVDWRPESVSWLRLLSEASSFTGGCAAIR